MESARTARPSDLQRLHQLWEAAEAEIQAQRGGATLAATQRPGLAQLVADPASMLAVGEIDGVAVGFCVASLDQRLDGRVATIDAVYVEPGAREVGVGEALLDMAIGWAARAGCSGLDAFALPGSRPAKAFFEGSGFVTRLLTMHRRIDAPSSSTEAALPDAGDAACTDAGHSAPADPTRGAGGRS